MPKYYDTLQSTTSKKINRKGCGPIIMNIRFNHGELTTQFIFVSLYKGTSKYYIPNVFTRKTKGLIQIQSKNLFWTTCWNILLYNWILVVVVPPNVVLKSQNSE